MRFDAGTSPLDGNINPFRIAAPDLINWLEARDPQAIDDWREAGTSEYARAFTAARTAGYDVIDDLYFALVDTVASGGTEIDYAAAVVPTLQRKGWLGGDATTIGSRVDLIYRTNLRMARGAGRWDRVQKQAPVFPYLRAVTARDIRVRRPPKSPHSDHRAWDGIILPVGHDFWRRWFPPLGFRCRCGVIQMSRSDLARWPGTITSDAELADREARLGVPIFRTPAEGIDAQLAAMVASSNAERLPGLPPINPDVERGRAETVWDASRAKAGHDAIERLLDDLFPRAA